MDNAKLENFSKSDYNDIVKKMKNGDISNQEIRLRRYRIVRTVSREGDRTVKRINEMEKNARI